MGSTHEHVEKRNGKRIAVAFLLNTAFTILEIAGGLLTNSVAILSDALHDLGDTLALALAWYLERKSVRGRSASYSYGYKRFSLLGAVSTSLILLTGSAIIIINAIPRLLHPEATHATGMIWFSVLGIAANGIAFYQLTGGSTLNERAVKLHLLEDVLGWVGVLVGAIIIKFTGWYVIDPILSLAIAAYISYNTLGNFMKAIKVFLQAVPDTIDVETVSRSLLAVPGVQGIHDLHVWSIDGNQNVLTVHMNVPETFRNDVLRIKKEVRDIMRDTGIEHCTLELEIGDEPCTMAGHED